MADITVNAGGNLQNALNSASGATNDRIICEAGATFTGPYNFPTKTGGKVTLTSSSILSGALPTRPEIADAGVLATATASAGSNWVFQAATGASNWTIDGFRFVPAGNGSGIIDFIGESCANNTFSRLLFDGSGGQQKRFLRADGRNVLIKHLYVHDLHKPGTDGQGISCVAGAGPFTIYHCYINGGSECILFGGGTSTSAANNPQDIVVEHCELSQPTGRYPTTHLAKNLFEIKNGLRVKFRYNILRDIEDSAQSATAIMLTPSNQQGDSPWSRVYDVEISHCRVSNVGRFLTIVGYGFTGDTYTEPTKHLFATMQTDLVRVRHILVETIADRFIQVAGEVADFRVEHCTHSNADLDDSIAIYILNDATCLRTGGVMGLQNYAVDTFTLKDNMIHGTVTSPLGMGITGCDRDDVVRTFVHANNVFGLDDPGLWTTQYPGETREDWTTYYDNFANTTDYPLDPASPHNNAASDGTDKGWDLDDGAPGTIGGTTDPIVWTSLTGTASAVGNDLTGPSIDSAISVASLSGDGKFEWVDVNATGEFYVGLGNNTAHDFLMSHAVEFGVGAHIRESNVYKGVSVSPRVAGDLWRLEAIGGVVKTYRNGTLIYTSAVAAGLPKKLDVAFFGAGGAITDATITTAAVDNVAPTVNAGPDVSIVVGGTAALNGTVVDDGQPTNTVTQTWTKLLGPGTVSFANANAAVTTATVTHLGTYILSLTASDGVESSSDNVSVMMTAPAGPNPRALPRVFRGNTEVTTRIRAT